MVMKNARFCACSFLCSALLVVAGESSTRPVKQAELDAKMAMADKIIVLELPVPKAKMLFSSTDRKDLEALMAAAQVVEDAPYEYCGCLGSPVIRLYRKGRLVVEFSNHHGVLMRCSLWKSDAPVKDPEAWLRWFDDRGMTKARQEYQEEELLKKKSQADWKRWMDAMPSCVRPLWDALGSGVGVEEYEKYEERVGKALQDAYPNPEDRIRVLLRWYGSGAGPWSGFPSYESEVEERLLEFPVADLISVGSDASLSTTEIEALARLLSSPRFLRRHPKGLALLPEPIKRRLLTHSLASSDEFNRKRAAAAFQ